MAFLRVKENTNFVRDTRSGAIINTNTDIQYLSKMRKMKSQEKSNEIERLKEQIEELKNIIKYRQ